MNYIDRKAIGLEQFFSKRSGSFSSLNEFSETDIAMHLEQAPFRTRVALAQLIHTSLRQLSQDFGKLDEIIPPSLAEQYSSLNPSISMPDKLLPFFRWLMELQCANEQRRVQYLSELSSCTARLDLDSRAFFQNFFSLNNQRVVVSLDGDSIVMTSAEREWGKVSAVFGHCGLDDPAALPLLGFAFGQECILLEDGRFQISLLIDTEFGDVDYCERLLSDSGWLEFSFTCDSMLSSPVCIDYVGRMNRLGTPRFEVIERAFSLLLNKAAVLGSRALTLEERKMLPIASFISGSIALLGHDDASGEYNEVQITETLDNRHAVSLLGDMLRECGCEQLATILSEAEEAAYNDSPDTAIKKAERFASTLEQQVSNGTARPLLYRLCSLLREMTAGLSGNTLRDTAEQKIISTVSATAEPTLDKLGFRGSFPHYQRTSGGNMEYISFMIDSQGDRPQRGVMAYYASIAAAQLPVTRCEKLVRAGIPMDVTNALDCLPEALSVSSYGELASTDDNEYIYMSVNCYDRDGATVVRDESARIPHFIEIAEQQFTRNSIPDYYRAARIHAAKLPELFGRSFMQCLPWGITAAIALLCIYVLGLKDGLLSHVPSLNACIVILLLALIILVVISILRCRSRSFRLWRY